MSYIKLTDNQVREYVLQLDSYELWRRCVVFARELYGPNAYKFEVEVYGQPDDEGGSYSVIESVYVTDRDGNELPIQRPSREFIEEYARGYTTLYDNWVTTDPDWVDMQYDDVNDFLNDTYSEMINLPENYAINGRTHSFEATVDEAPVRNFTQLFAREDDNE